MGQGSQRSALVNRASNENTQRPIPPSPTPKHILEAETTMNPPPAPKLENQAVDENILRPPSARYAAPQLGEGKEKGVLSNDCGPSENVSRARVAPTKKRKVIAKSGKISASTEFSMAHITAKCPGPDMQSLCANLKDSIERKRVLLQQLQRV